MNRPWEFDSDNPLRCASIPLLISGSALLPIKLLNVINNTTRIMSTHVLVALPRLVTTALSLITDVALHEIAFKLNLDRTLCMVLYALSCVSLVFYTRTLSNTVEAFVFSLLLYCVFDRYIDYINRNNVKIENKLSAIKENPAYKKSKLKKQKKQISVTSNEKSENCFNKHSILTDSLIIGVTLALGFFNRPTFLLFALVPYLIFIFCEGFNVGMIAKKGLLSFVYFLFSCAVLILIDSIYFGKLDIEKIKWEKLSVYNLVAQNVTVTPLNFIKYNLNSSNLAEHGIHPKFTHITANMMMLFGPFAILFYLQCFRYTYYFIKGSSSIQKVYFYLSACALVPISLLSIFPHQEARFLIPVSPIVLLLAVDWLTTCKYSSAWKASWFIFNILTCVFFGILHQGGLIPCMSELESKISAQTNENSMNHFVFYHTYMPPQYLLAIPKSQKIYGKKHTLLDTEPRQFMVHDLKGTFKFDLDHFIWDLMFVGNKLKKDTSVYVISPATLHEEVIVKWSKYTLHLQQQFFPHLTMEDPIKFDLKWNLKSFLNVLDQMKLNLYIVQVSE